MPVRRQNWQVRGLVQAQCCTCRWRRKDKQNVVVAAAGDHARATGHTVEVARTQVRVVYI